MKKIWRKVPADAKQNYTQRARLNRTKKRAMKGASGQSSGTGRSGKRKNSSKQQSSEPEDNNNDGGGGSESRSSTPSSSTTNEPTNVVSHPSEQHQEHPPSHLYQQSRPMYSPSGGLMVATPTNPPNFHHQPYPTQQRPQQQGYLFISTYCFHENCFLLIDMGHQYQHQVDMHHHNGSVFLHSNICYQTHLNHSNLRTLRT